MTDTARLGWVIVYVPDVTAAIEFYEKAFGARARLHRGGRELRRAEDRRDEARVRQRAEGDSHFEGGFRRPDPDQPFNFEVALVFDDPAAAFARAVETGASRTAEPKEQPWGQVVAYVRDPFGTLVEMASPTD